MPALNTKIGIFKLRKRSANTSNFPLILTVDVSAAWFTILFVIPDETMQFDEFVYLKMVNDNFELIERRLLVL